ncbi:hypothetical protein KLAE6086_00860 [Klebsiella aerogenes]|nr:Uncharacterised protein [Klebsiella aerogenes]
MFFFLLFISMILSFSKGGGCNILMSSEKGILPFHMLRSHTLRCGFSLFSAHHSYAELIEVPY